MPSDSLSSFLEHARKLPLLTKTEERELARRSSAGDESARAKLVEHNVRLAVRHARDWVGCGLSLEDLVQEACVGLAIAAERFDPDKGRFTTYATQWIKKMLWEAGYGTTDTIRRPSSISRTVVRIQEYLSTHPHASIEEIAIATKKSESEIREALDHARVVTSTDDDGFREVGEEELEEIASTLDVLDREEREAISWRHGLYGEECGLEIVAERMTRDESLPGTFSLQDAGRLCRSAVRKLRAARYEDDDDAVICTMRESEL